MIAYLNGPITYRSPTQVTIDIGGLGYEIQISLNTYTALKESTKTKLYTYLHITSDSQTLYGFVNIVEKQWFLYLLQVNGIGPRAAITILSFLTPTELQQAIVNQQTATIQAIKGIGPKTAQRIVLELHDKIDKLPYSKEGTNTAIPYQNTLMQEALTALVKLGMNKPMAEKAISKVYNNHAEGLTLEKLIKLSLQA